jgi:hypothetical protein
MTDNITVVEVRAGGRDHMVKQEAGEWKGPWNRRSQSCSFITALSQETYPRSHENYFNPSAVT